MGSAVGAAERQMIPLIAEVILLTLAAFGLGTALAWFIEWRRQARANWSW